MARPRTSVARWTFALLGCLAAGPGCAQQRSSDSYDPYVDATHLPRMGQTESFGRNPNSVPLTGSNGRARRETPGRFGKDIDRLQHLADLQWVHRETHERLDEVDIDAVFERLRKRVDRSSSHRDSRAAVRRAVCELSDGNLRIVPPVDATLRDSGLRFVVANGALLALRATDGRYRSRPKSGEMVVAVDGRPTWRYLNGQCVAPGSSPRGRHAVAADRLGLQRRTAGEGIRPRKIQLRRASGTTYTLKLQWRLDQPSTEPCVVASRPHPSLGVLEIKRFGCEEEVEGQPEFARQLASAMAELDGAEHLAIDIRNTRGDNMEMAKLAASELAPGSTGWIRGRRADGGAFVDAPRGPATGAVHTGASRWGFIGPRCAELCEVFAGALASSPNTIMIGSATAGSIGRGIAEPKHYSLPSLGMVVAIPDTVYALPGTDDSLEGRGIRPAIEVQATFETVQRGRDAVVDGVLRRTTEQ